MTSSTPLFPECFAEESFSVVNVDMLAENVIRYGADQNGDAQLVELFLTRPKPGRAEALLRKAGGLQYLLSMATSGPATEDLSPLEAARLAAIPELLRRQSRAMERPRITSPRAASDYLVPKAHGLTEEVFGILALNARGDLLADQILFKGTDSAVISSPREVFRAALRFGAHSVVAWHNHPSQHCDPSPEDVAMTKRLRECGESLGVPLSDHIIVGGTSTYSFRAAQGWDQSG